MAIKKNGTRMYTEATDLKMQAFLILSLILSPTSSRTPNRRKKRIEIAYYKCQYKSNYAIFKTM